MKASAVSRTLLVSLLCVLCSVRAGPQTPPALEKIASQAELEKTIAMVDTALFDAYNRCDLEKFASLLSENVEFYHDERGLTVGKGALTDSVKQHACGRVTRELVPGSLTCIASKALVRLRWGFNAFVTRAQSHLMKQNLFICSNARMAPGKLRGSSFTTTTLYQNNAILKPSAGGCRQVPGESEIGKLKPHMDVSASIRWDEARLCRAKYS